MNGKNGKGQEPKHIPTDVASAIALREGLTFAVKSIGTLTDEFDGLIGLMKAMYEMADSKNPNPREMDEQVRTRFARVCIELSYLASVLVTVCTLNTTNQMIRHGKTVGFHIHEYK